MPLLKEPSAAFGNGLLSSLPQAEYQRLAPHLELVRLTAGKILYNAGDIVRHAYFLKGGMASLLSTTEDGRSIEVASDAAVACRAPVRPQQSGSSAACGKAHTASSRCC